MVTHSWEVNTGQVPLSLQTIPTPYSIRPNMFFFLGEMLKIYGLILIFLGVLQPEWSWW